MDREYYNSLKSEDDKLEYLTEIAEKKAELLNISKEILASKNLPVEFSRLISSASKNIDEIKANVANIEKYFEKEIENAIEEKFIGNSFHEVTTYNNTFTREAIMKMSPREINENWNSVKDTLNSK